MTEFTFKFQLQDIVIPKAVVEEWKAQQTITPGLGIFSPGFIIQRRTDECSAGVQKSYVIEFRGVNVTHREDSLILYEEYFMMAYDKIQKARTP